MPTYKQINVRSPRMLSLTGTAGQEAKVELFIWNHPDTEPVTATRTLTKPIPSTTVTTVNFDVSPYIKEYIDIYEFVQASVVGDVSTEEYCYARAKMWVNGVVVDNDYFIATKGYGYFNEGFNPENNPSLRGENSFQVLEDTNGGNMYLYNDGTALKQAKYTTFQGTVLTSLLASFTAEMVVFPCIPDSLKGEGGLTLEILSDSVVTDTYTFTEVCEPKYTVVTCDFVNKQGVWQQMPFFKASRTSTAITNSEYKLMPESVNYDINRNIKQSFNTNMMERIKLNTGWIPESNNEIIRQLMLSDTIRLDGAPVNINTKSLDELKGVNDNLINYELEFEYANNIVNNIQ